MKTQTEVAIIGGGPAGLTAALALGRIGRKVTVFDDNNGRNFPASHMMNFPSRDGTPPQEFRELIIKDLRKYQEVSFRSERANEIEKKGDVYVINGNTEAKKIILAHGVRDILPAIPGIKDLWGKAVFHCPFCHGHEFKGQMLGLLSSDLKYLSHMIPLVLSLTDKVSVFSNGETIDLPPQLKTRVTLIPSPVRKLIYEDDNLHAVETVDGNVRLNGLLIKPPQELTTDVGRKLGCEINEFGLYKTENEVQTTIPGVYSAGDVSVPMQALLVACSLGMKAAAYASFELVAEALEK